MSEKKRYILVGLGEFAWYWCRDMVPKAAGIAQMVAAVDPNPAGYQYAIDAGLPADKCYATLEQAAAENAADFIIAVTPPTVREAVIDSAIALGLDILSEKPLANDLASCCRIYQKAKAAGRKLAITTSHSYEEEKQILKRLVDSGEYGKPHCLISRLTMHHNQKGKEGIHRHGDGSPEDILAIGAIHNFDTLRIVSGGQPKTVYCGCWAYPSAEPGEEGVGTLAQMVFDNGVRATLEESFGNAAGLDDWGKEYLRAECTGATIIATGARVSLLSDVGGERALTLDIPPEPDELWGHNLIIRQFCDWVGGGPVAPTCIDDHLQSCALTFAAEESSRTGQPVDVQAFLARHMP